MNEQSATITKENILDMLLSTLEDVTEWGHDGKDEAYEAIAYTEGVLHMVQLLVDLIESTQSNT